MAGGVATGSHFACSTNTNAPGVTFSICERHQARARRLTLMLADKG
jgi:hypothetical protein